MTQRSPDTAFVRRDIDQPNLIDGSILCYEIRHNGAYVTVAGNDDDEPLILSFDVVDIGVLRSIADYFGPPPPTSVGV